MRVRSPRSSDRRTAAAAVEFAVVVNFVMLPLMLGLWEMGRVVHVQQIISNAAREGARLAGQGQTLDQNGNLTQIMTSIDPSSNTANAPNVKAAVMQSLYGAGLTSLRWSDVTVTFTFMDTPAGATSGATDPWQGVKNQRIRVNVSIPFQKVRWINLGLVNPTTISYSADWQMLIDDPFQVDTNLPSPFSSTPTW